MALPGFPWNANADHADDTVAFEKETHHRHSEPRIDADPMSDGFPHRSPSLGSHDHHHHHHKAKVNGSTRKRGDSLKSSLAARQAAHQQYLRTPLKDPIKRPTARTIPPWVQDADEDDVLEAGLNVPQSPHSAFVAQHNHSPSTAQRPLLGGHHAQLHQRGHLTSSGRVRTAPTSRWISFARASAYPREDFNGEKVDPQWLDENLTDYSKPWLADHDDEDDEDGSDKYRAFQAKRRAWYKRIHFAIMRNPFVPLFFRLFVIAFAAAAMGLGARIFHLNHVLRGCIDTAPADRSASCVQRVGTGEVTYNQDPSALMAIIVDAVAIVYSIYITYDEYFSKPLGLRPPAAKVRLVLLDLFFIVFQSANLSLAFNSLTIDQGPCRAGDNEDDNIRFDTVCDCAESLSAVLLVSLVAWLLTFSISVLRLVERINAR